MWPVAARVRPASESSFTLFAAVCSSGWTVLGADHSNNDLLISGQTCPLWSSWSRADVRFKKMLFMMHSDFVTGSLKIYYFKVLFWGWVGNKREFFVYVFDNVNNYGQPLNLLVTCIYFFLFKNYNMTS